jgi:hypothetical protein
MPGMSPVGLLPLGNGLPVWLKSSTLRTPRACRNWNVRSTRPIGVLGAGGLSSPEPLLM